MGGTWAIFMIHIIWVIELKLFGVEKSKSNLRWDNLIERFLSRPKIELGRCWSPKPITDFEFALRHFITNHQFTYRFNSYFGLKFFVCFENVIFHSKTSFFIKNIIFKKTSFFHKKLYFVKMVIRSFWLEIFD